MLAAAIATLSLFLGLLDTALAQDTLPRRISLGVQVKPVTEETQNRLKLRNDRGVEVVSVFPDSVAASADVKTGDVIAALGEKKVSDLASFVEQVAALRAGKELPITVQREGGQTVLNAQTKPLPQETSDEFTIEYSFVTTANGRLRTVVTSPKGAEKTKGVLLLSGLGLGFVEHPVVDPLGLKAIAYALTRAGMTVMRVDRPGCGDSEGGPAKDADFESVVKGYVAATIALKNHPNVRPDQVALFGFSAGALEAPLVAAQVPVADIAVFGSLSLDWQDYMLSTTRRQLRLAGVPEGQVQQVVAQQSAGWHYLIFEQKSPDDIAQEHDELTQWVDQNWSEGTYFSGIHFKFFQQLGKANIAAAWEQFDGRVLAMWGDADFVTSEQEHQLIAEIVNKKRIGNGTYQKISGVDHNLRIARPAINPAQPGNTQPAAGQSEPPAAVISALNKWINANS